MRSMTVRRAVRTADQQPRRRPAAIAVGVALTTFLAIGVSGADATSTTTGVAITPVSPVKTISTGASVGAGKTYSFVASGGASPVPTHATVVQLAITVKGTKAGMLTFFPTGDTSAASPTTLSWPAGGNNAGTVNVNIGVDNKVSVGNSSAATATVGVKITGYSTQVTSGSINGSGGSAGQVLTNNGNGTTSWNTPGRPLTARVRVNGPNSVSLRPGGDATAISYVAVGDYAITFPRVSVANCAVSIAGSVIGSGAVAFGAEPVAFPSPGHPDQLRIQVRAPNLNTLSYELVDSSFDLTLVC